MMTTKFWGELLDRAHGRWRDPVLTGLTVLLVLIMFVIAPLHTADLVEAPPLNALAILLMTGGLLVVSRSLAPVLVVVAAVALNGAAVLVYARGGEATLIAFFEATAWLLVSLLTISVVAHAVFAPGKVTYHRVIGAVLLYLAIGAVFVSLFTYIGVLAPGSFTGVAVGSPRSLPSDLVYFSFVTLTTVGYGDIAPVHPVARSLCNVEAILGQLYPATVLARIVTLEVESRR